MNTSVDADVSADNASYAYSDTTFVSKKKEKIEKDLKMCTIFIILLIVISLESTVMVALKYEAKTIQIDLRVTDTYHARIYKQIENIEKSINIIKSDAIPLSNSIITKVACQKIDQNTQMADKIIDNLPEFKIYDKINRTFEGVTELNLYNCFDDAKTCKNGFH